MGAIVLVDTTILLNVLDVPGRNKERAQVIAMLEGYIEQGCSLLLPMAVMLETARWIHNSKATGVGRSELVARFVETIKKALEGDAPWLPLGWPPKEEILLWIEEYPERAANGVSFADLSIIKDWEKTRKIHKGKRVLIYSLDHHLSSYDTEALKKKRR